MPRIASPALVLLVVAGCIAPPRRPPESVPFQSEPWKFGSAAGIRIMTAHYDIRTTLRDHVLLDAVPGFVEAAYQHYASLLPPVRPAAERMPVYLFASRTQWEAFTRRFGGERAGLLLKVRYGGYCERGVTVIEYVAHQVTFPLLMHEGFHQYVHHHLEAPLPAWLNEGLAVLCEGQRWGASHVEAFDPWYNPKRRNDLAEALARDRLYSLRKLLASDAGDVIDSGARSIATYYAQVWALVLFLRDGSDGRYAPGLKRLLDAAARGELAAHARAAQIWSDRGTPSYGEDVFRAFISDDLDAVNREYVAFMRDRFLE